MAQIDHPTSQVFFTTSAAAKFLNISLRTVQRAVKAGQLKARPISPGRKLIHKRDLYAFALFGKSRLSASERKELEEYLSD